MENTQLGDEDFRIELIRPKRAYVKRYYLHKCLRKIDLIVSPSKRTVYVPVSESDRVVGNKYIQELAGKFQYNIQLVI